MRSRHRRKLVAILVADVVGYSRLMEADEAGTLERLQRLRDTVVDPAFTEFGGRIVKTTGDGILAEFASTVDFVECAVAIQTGVATESAKEPPDRRLRFRVGLHVGDVIVDDDDIYGDGVNVAARLEGIAVLDK